MVSFSAALRDLHRERDGGVLVPATANDLWPGLVELCPSFQSEGNGPVPVVHAVPLPAVQGAAAEQLVKAGRVAAAVERQHPAQCKVRLGMAAILASVARVVQRTKLGPVAGGASLLDDVRVREGVRRG